MKMIVFYKGQIASSFILHSSSHWFSKKARGEPVLSLCLQPLGTLPLQAWESF